MEKISDIFGFIHVNGILAMISNDARIDIATGKDTHCIVATLPENIDNPAEYCTIHDARIVL